MTRVTCARILFIFFRRLILAEECRQTTGHKVESAPRLRGPAFADS